jgi:hypothetical protein
MVGKDAIWSEPPTPVEIGEVRLESLRFNDIGERVLHRVSAEEEPLLCQPDHRCIVAVNIGLDQLDVQPADVEMLPL